MNRKVYHLARSFLRSMYKFTEENNNLAIIFGTFVIIIAISLFARQKSMDHEVLDLSSECSKQSIVFFNRENKDSLDSYTYTNHFSKKFNKCFILYKVQSETGNSFETLVDVNENKEYGTMLRNPTKKTILGCMKDDSDVCDNLTETQAGLFFKEYMED